MQNISWQQENADRTIFIKGEHSSSQGRVHKFGFDQSIKDPLREELHLPCLLLCNVLTGVTLTSLPLICVL